MLCPTMFRSAIAIFWPELADYWASNVGICGSARDPPFVRKQPREVDLTGNLKSALTLTQYDPLSPSL